MKEWIWSQFYHFNFLTFIVIAIYVTSMSKADNNKMLIKLHEELYNDKEEIKDEIRGQRR
jgi:hypothetical protein